MAPFPFHESIVLHFLKERNLPPEVIAQIYNHHEIQTLCVKMANHLMSVQSYVSWVLLHPDWCAEWSEYTRKFFNCVASLSPATSVHAFNSCLQEQAFLDDVHNGVINMFFRDPSR